MPSADPPPPFVGRFLPTPEFSGDDGATDPLLERALAAYAVDPARAPDVLFALAASRVLVPIVAVLATAATTSAGLTHDTSSDMALVTIVGRDGRRALPVFGSLASLAAWRPDARPVPVQAQRAALSAYAENAEVLLLDVGGPRTFLVEGQALRALAEGTVRRPLYDDDEASAALAAATRDQAAVIAGRLEPAPGADARVVLTLRAGTSATAVAQVVAERLRDSDVFRSRVLRGLELAVEPPNA